MLNTQQTWESPPPPPRKRRRWPWIVAIIAAVFVLIGIVASVGGSSGGGQSEPAPKQEPGVEGVQPEPDIAAEERAKEQKDLKSFKVDDRSSLGVPDVWVTWIIANSSSEKSDYTWDWEAVNSNGTRVGDGTEYVTNVQPGQKVKGEDVTMLEDPNVTINITAFDRSAAL